MEPGSVAIRFLIRIISLAVSSIYLDVFTAAISEAIALDL